MKQNISRDKSALFKNTTSVFFSVSKKSCVEVGEAERGEILQVSHRTLIISSFNGGSVWRCTFALRLIKTALMRKITRPPSLRFEVRNWNRHSVPSTKGLFSYSAERYLDLTRRAQRNFSEHYLITSSFSHFARAVKRAALLPIEGCCLCYIARDYIEWHLHFNLVNPTFLHISPFSALIDVKTITSVKSSTSRLRDGFFPTVIRTHVHHQDAVRVSNIDQDEENDKRL